MQVNAVGGRYEVEPCGPGAGAAASVLFGIGRGFDRAALDVAATTLVA